MSWKSTCMPSGLSTKSKRETCQPSKSDTSFFKLRTQNRAAIYMDPSIRDSIQILLRVRPPDPSEKDFAP
nr:hypothetical protein BgiMline_024495 [Biomphalaria glabrata]